MATLEQIIEEVRKLPVEEQRRLRAALESLDSNGEAQFANQKPSQVMDVRPWDTLTQLLADCEIDTGVPDLASQHDHYLLVFQKGRLMSTVLVDALA